MIDTATVMIELWLTKTEKEFGYREIGRRASEFLAKQLGCNVLKRISVSSSVLGQEKEYECLRCHLMDHPTEKTWGRLGSNSRKHLVRTRCQAVNADCAVHSFCASVGNVCSQQLAPQADKEEYDSMISPDRVRARIPREAQAHALVEEWRDRRAGDGGCGGSGGGGGGGVPRLGFPPRVIMERGTPRGSGGGGTSGGGSSATAAPRAPGRGDAAASWR